MSAYDNSVNPDFLRNMLYINNIFIAVNECVKKTTGTTVKLLETQIAALQDQVSTHISELTHGAFLTVLEASDESGK